MLQILPITLAQVKAGNTSENLINEIRKLINSLYRLWQWNHLNVNSANIADHNKFDKFEHNKLRLLFLDPLSFEIRFRLQKCLKNYIPYCSLKVVYQSKSRISNLFNFKDVVNTKLSSHIIYKFMYSCCNATYYGQTQRHFFVRASEHLGTTPLTGKFVKTPKKSAIFDHILLDGHKASFDNFLIILKENNAFKLLLKESLLISRDKPISLGTVWLILTVLLDIYCYLCNPMSIHHYYIKL